MGRQWGNTDDAANSVLWAATYVNLPANTTNQTAVFGNTTIGAFNNGGVAMNKAVGQFGLDVNEISVAVGNTAVAQYVIINPGSGYSANAAVTVANTTGGANTLAANSTATGGRITAITANGTTIRGYTAIPAVTIAAPTAQSFNANSAVTNATDAIAITTANSFFLAGDRVTYTVAAGNTALTNLVSGTTYVIKTSNTTAVTLAAGINAPTIDLTKGLTETGHSLTGETATATAVLTGRGYTQGAAHTGWVLRTVGTGGRAGRVQYETLVAMGGNLTTDGSDDAIIHDA